MKALAALSMVLGLALFSMGLATISHPQPMEWDFVQVVGTIGGPFGGALMFLSARAGYQGATRNALAPLSLVAGTLLVGFGLLAFLRPYTMDKNLAQVAGAMAWLFGGALLVLGERAYDKPSFPRMTFATIFTGVVFLVLPRAHSGLIFLLGVWIWNRLDKRLLNSRTSGS